MKISARCWPNLSGNHANLTTFKNVVEGVVSAAEDLIGVSGEVVVEEGASTASNRRSRVMLGVVLKELQLHKKSDSFTTSFSPK